MSKRIFCEDTVQIDHRNYVEDNDPVFGATTVFKDVVIASEIIHPYEDGRAYKPADELKAAYWTWQDRWAISGDHPSTGIISKRGDVHGRTVNLRYVKNLKDHKTGRPNRRGVLADLQVFDSKVNPEVLQDMKSGKKSDVSIGFFFTMDKTGGVVEDIGHPLDGQAYDYVQRDFMGDHTAFGIDNGRCSMPYCGIGADRVMEQFAGDPFGEWENFAECVKDLMRPKSEGGQGYTKEQAEATYAKIEEAHKEKHKSDAPIDSSMDTPLLEEVRDALQEILSRLPVAESIEDVEEEVKEDVGPRTEAERAKAHFNLSDEEWEALSEEEKQAYIDKLPERGSGGEDDEECTGCNDESGESETESEAAETPKKKRGDAEIDTDELLLRSKKAIRKMTHPF